MLVWVRFVLFICFVFYFGVFCGLLHCFFHPFFGVCLGLLGSSWDVGCWLSVGLLCFGWVCLFVGLYLFL